MRARKHMCQYMNVCIRTCTDIHMQSYRGKVMRKNLGIIEIRIQVLFKTQISNYGKKTNLKR